MSKKPERKLTYRPAVGALFLTVGADEFGYWFDRVTSEGSKRTCVRLTKFAAAQKPGEPDHYDVQVDTDAATCDCPGHRRWGHCKHADAITTLAARGSI